MRLRASTCINFILLKMKTNLFMNYCKKVKDKRNNDGKCSFIKLNIRRKTFQANEGWSKLMIEVYKENFSNN